MNPAALRVLEGALTAEDALQAQRAARRLEHAPAFAHVADVALRLRCLARAMQAAVLAGDTETLVRLQPRLHGDLLLLPEDSPARLEAELESLCLRAELASLVGDIASQHTAVERCVEQLLEHAFVLPLHWRDRVLLSVVDLLVRLGLRTWAALLARQRARHSGSAPAFARLACTVLVDLPRAACETLCLGIKPLLEDPRPDAVPLPLRQRAQALRALANATVGAEALRCSAWADMSAWLAHALPADAAAESVQQWHAWAEARGLQADLATCAQFQQWLRLATQLTAAGPYDRPNLHFSEDDHEAHFAAAAHHLAAGCCDAAHRAYTRHAVGALRLIALSEQILADGLPAAAELLAALPARADPTPDHGAAVRMLRDCLRLHRGSQGVQTMREIGTALGITPRRLQQACKSLGLPSPRKLLARRTA